MKKGRGLFDIDMQVYDGAEYANLPKQNRNLII